MFLLIKKYSTNTCANTSVLLINSGLSSWKCQWKRWQAARFNSLLRLMWTHLSLTLRLDLFFIFHKHLNLLKNVSLFHPLNWNEFTLTNKVSVYHCISSYWLRVCGVSDTFAKKGAYIKLINIQNNWKKTSLLFVILSPSNASLCLRLLSHIELSPAAWDLTGLLWKNNHYHPIWYGCVIKNTCIIRRGGLTDHILNRIQWLCFSSFFATVTWPNAYREVELHTYTNLHHKATQYDHGLVTHDQWSSSSRETGAWLLCPRVFHCSWWGRGKSFSITPPKRFFVATLGIKTGDILVTSSMLPYCHPIYTLWQDM